MGKCWMKTHISEPISARSHGWCWEQPILSEFVSCSHEWELSLFRESWPECHRACPRGWPKEAREVSWQTLPWPASRSAFTCAKESLGERPSGILSTELWRLSSTKNLKVLYEIESTVNICQAQGTSMTSQHRTTPGKLLLFPTPLPSQPTISSPPLQDPGGVRAAGWQVVEGAVESQGEEVLSMSPRSLSY